MHVIKRYNELNEEIGIPFTDIRYYFKNDNDLVFKIIKDLKKNFDPKYLNINRLIDTLTYKLIINENDHLHKNIDPYNEDNWYDENTEQNVLEIFLERYNKRKENEYMVLKINNILIKATRSLKIELWDTLMSAEETIKKRMEIEYRKDAKKQKIKEKDEYEKNVKNLKNVFKKYKKLKE